MHTCSVVPLPIIRCQCIAQLADSEHVLCPRIAYCVQRPDMFVQPVWLCRSRLPRLLTCPRQRWMPCHSVLPGAQTVYVGTGSTPLPLVLPPPHPRRACSSRVWHARTQARKVSTSDIQLVQNLIERCLQMYLSQREVIATLQSQAKIEPGFTGLVWQVRSPTLLLTALQRCR